MKHIHHYINGSWVSGGSLLSVMSPLSKVDGYIVPIGDENVVNESVKAARLALNDWSSMSVVDRSGILLKFAEWLACEYGSPGEITSLKSRINLTMGKPIPEADIEVIETSDFIRYFCEIAPGSLERKSLSLDQNLWPNKRSVVEYLPYGVVGIIKPWNYPLELIAWSAIPAMLGGNTVIIKSSERSSDIAAVFGEMADAAGLPKGVLNVIHGDLSTGQILVRHDNIDYVSFTGSVVAGRNIAIECASRLRKCSLELGGNDAAIVLEDVDVDLVSSGLTWGAFCNAGQVCVGVKRVYILSSVYDAVVERVLEKTKSLRFGVDVGPMVDQRQLSYVEEFIDDAVRKGAKVLVGGNVDRDNCYCQPTVIVDVPSDAKLLSKECFGPILPIMKVDNIEEAISRANSTDFGLGASVWGRNIDKANSVASKLHAGMIWLNDVNVAFPQAPWSGWKSSGIGVELGEGCLLEYVRPKHLCTETSDEKKRAWWYPY